jgi:hypothetical protein
MEAGLTDAAALRRPLAPEEIVDFVADHGTPYFAPDAAGRWYALLGMVIEGIERKPLGKSFETRIFGPLGMEDTYLWNGITSRDFGLPRSWARSPLDWETTSWNMSQGGRPVA